jgi:hypothetical protein
MKKLLIALFGAVCLLCGAVVVSQHVVENTAAADPNC